MNVYILDTDHVSLHQRRHPTVTRRVVRELNAVTSIITVEEQLRGRLNVIRRVATPEEITHAYENLLTTVRYFNGLVILPFNQEALRHYEQLRAQKIRVGTQDLRIAAIVLSVDGILITRNERDFAQVPGLVWENWADTL
jgi:tRNA(fMet)-specific endonuclease VapC